jgi:lysozyme
MGKRQVPTRPDYIKWLLLLGVAVLVVLFGLYVGRRYILPHSVNVDRYRYPIAGIDVSKHNGEIDFDQVSDDNYQFVFIKASEGKTYQDDAFERNYAGARNAGLKVGAYHFFRKNRSGKEQADNFLNVIKGKPMDLPLVIDLEDDWGNGVNIDRKLALERVLDMINILNDKGYPVMIYTNLDGYGKYYKDMLGDHDLWLCSFTSPDLLPEMPHCIQQFSHEGNVAGVKGDVDLNVFRGTKKEWNRYLDDVQKQLSH